MMSPNNLRGFACLTSNTEERKRPLRLSTELVLQSEVSIQKLFFKFKAHSVFNIRIIFRDVSFWLNLQVFQVACNHEAPLSLVMLLTVDW